MLSDLSSTKRSIIETAVRLFAEKNYEIVTMRDIGEAVGIKKPSLYAHFASKQEILDTIYDFYEEHYPAERPTLEQIEPIIHDGSVIDILNSVIYNFREEYNEIMVRMAYIVYQRSHLDKRAKEIACNIMNNDGVVYVESVFNHAIELGRLAPFNVHTLAVVMVNMRNSMLRQSMIDQSVESFQEALKVEQNLLHAAAKLITDLKPPA